MTATVTITVERELVERFRDARDKRRARGDVDTEVHVDADKAHDDELEAAHLLALHVANQVEGI